MNDDLVSNSTDNLSANGKKSVRKKAKEKRIIIRSFAEIIEETKKIDPEKPKALEENAIIFDTLRGLKMLSNNQVDEYFDLIESTLGNQWITFLTKISTILICHAAKDNDLKIASSIRMRCKYYMETYKILEGNLASAEKNLCLLNDGGYVTQFLQDAKKSNKECEKQIPDVDLACLTFICFSLYNKTANDGNTKVQVLIDRAITEFFASTEHSGIKARDFAGRTVSAILSAKVYSPKKLAELSYLYDGTTEQLSEQSSQIRKLNEIRRNQAERLNQLSEEVSRLNGEKRILQESVETLQLEVQQAKEERTAAENMLDYERNKFEKLIATQEAGAAAQISEDISLELIALREIAENMEAVDQKRILRRVDRIERYLKEFGGE